MKERIEALLARRHFWHKLKLSELSELYMSLTLRVLGLNLVGIFIPIYLYNQGFSLQSIAIMYIGAYGWRLISDPITAKLVVRYGPKHILRSSFVADIGFILAVLATGNFMMPMWSLAIIFSLSMSLFMVPFHVDLSLVERLKTAGHELSILTMLEKLAAAIGPLAGGLIASIFGFEIAVVVALGIMLVAMIPLYASEESYSSTQLKYNFSLLPPKISTRNKLVMFGRAGSATIGSFFWPLLATLAIFSADSYAGLGFITAVGLAATLFSAHLIGKLVDNNKGRELLRYGVVLASLAHMVKPLITTGFGAAGISVISETLDSTHRLPWMKGYYAEASSAGKNRVSYILATLTYFHIGEVLLVAGLATLTYFTDDLSALSVIILVSSLMSLLVLVEKYKALND